MGFLDRLRGRIAKPAKRQNKPSSEEMKYLETMLAAMESGSLDPPRDMHDSAAWDQYWNKQLEFGAMEQSMMDQMASDPSLPSLLTRRGVRFVLCAGNGLSREAVALAMYGFHVTALDISSLAAAAFHDSFANPEHPVRQVSGSVLRDDGTLVFSDQGQIDSALAPPMHHSAGQHKGGGTLTFVAGDLTRPDVCRGPYDAVIERRTLQLFGDEKIAALDGLIARLRPKGIFVSHEHAGAWRPGDPRNHYAEAHLRNRGFAVHHGDGEGVTDAPRVAYLLFSSG